MHPVQCIYKLGACNVAKRTNQMKNFIATWQAPIGYDALNWVYAMWQVELIKKN